MSNPPHPLSNGSSSSHPPALHRSNGSSGYLQLSASHPAHARMAPRVDLATVKQDLHDALGENGLPYWKALNGYLMGQIGRGELEGLVRGWLKGSKLELHNKLLLSLLHNAAIPAHVTLPSSPLLIRKRKRVGPDDPEFDTDESVIEPKSRVHLWTQGILATKDRHKLKRAWHRIVASEQEGEKEGDSTWEHDKQSTGIQMQPGNTMPPLASSAKLLPSSAQLASRLSSLAKGYDLHIAPDAMNDIGEFLAIGMDAHMSDILHAHLHLTARDRPGNNTIRIPPGLNAEYPSTHLPPEEEVPKPDLDSLRTLITLNPSLHSSTSPALYRLTSGITPAEAVYNASPVKNEPVNSLALRNTGSGGVGGIGPKERKGDRVNRYLENGMIKFDAAKEEKKDKKHASHWKYEDPALILESVLG